MDELVASYRITINPHSKIRSIQHTIFVCWYLLVVYFWPYFIPLFVKVTLILVTLILIFFYLYLNDRTLSKSSYDAEVLYVSELGQIEWVKSAELGQLLTNSYFWPFCFYLRISNPIKQVTYWKVIFKDQLDDDSVRRLRRIIKTIKSQ